MSQIEENQATTKSASRSTVVVSLAAVGSVIAASSCCLPVLPFLFAAGAAGTSAFVGQLRPYLLVLPVLLIAFGFYKSWRAKQCNCKPSRISTFLLWFSAIVVFVFIFFPQVIANLVADLLAGKSWIESKSLLSPPFW
jgi:nitric oxide reductase large subunit